MRTETSIAFTLNVIFFSVGGIFSGILNKKLSFPAILRIAAVMVGAGFFLSSFADQVWILYITYSFLCGVGIGLGYNAVVSTVPLWFPEKIGAINGILLTGYALSSAVLGVAIHAMIENMGIVNAFRVLAVICMAGLFLGSFNLKMPNMDQIQKLPRPKRHDGEKVYNLFTLQMIKTPIFWTYFFLSSKMCIRDRQYYGHAGFSYESGLSESVRDSAYVSVRRSTAADTDVGRYYGIFQAVVYAVDDAERGNAVCYIEKFK